MSSSLSRRRLLGAGIAGAGYVLLGAPTLSWAAVEPTLRRPDSLPDPGRPAGVPDPAIPIDTVIVVMMENHSFDNYLGLLPWRGQPLADGWQGVDGSGRPTVTNPVSRNDPSQGVIRAFPMPSACQPEHEPNQSWGPTHVAIDGGRMDGFVEASGDVAMGYWSDADLPFYYDFARTFTLGNRWFPSLTGQTYPNRRYLQAATSYGLVSSTLPSPTEAGPANGTLLDRLNSYGVSWTNYFTDIPALAVVPATVRNNPSHFAPIAQFYADAAAGRLPSVCFVDPDFGATDVVGGVVPGDQTPTIVRAQGGDEENPQNIRYGEAFVAGVVNAVTASPQWKSTLLLWVYDEHGGYYDHVPPPKAVAPDDIPPDVPADQQYDGFRQLGVRVPAVVASPYSKPGGVSDVVHDHTSFMAFVERKWNLPACTYRDANAADMTSFLDFSAPRMLEVPVLAAPSDPLTAACDTNDPGVSPQPPPDLPEAGGLPTGALIGGAALATGLATWHARRYRGVPFAE